MTSAGPRVADGPSHPPSTATMRRADERVPLINGLSPVRPAARDPSRVQGAPPRTCSPSGRPLEDHGLRNRRQPPLAAGRTVRCRGRVRPGVRSIRRRVGLRALATGCVSPLGEAAADEEVRRHSRHRYRGVSRALGRPPAPGSLADRGPASVPHDSRRPRGRGSPAPSCSATRAWRSCRAGAPRPCGSRASPPPGVLPSRPPPVSAGRSSPRSNGTCPSGRQRNRQDASGVWPGVYTRRGHVLGIGASATAVRHRASCDPDRPDASTTRGFVHRT
jgi:hypothetical protein